MRYQMMFRFIMAILVSTSPHIQRETWSIEFVKAYHQNLSVACRNQTKTRGVGIGTIALSDSNDTVFDSLFLDYVGLNACLIVKYIKLKPVLGCKRFMLGVNYL